MSEKSFERPDEVRSNVDPALDGEFSQLAGQEQAKKAHAEGASTDRADIIPDLADGLITSDPGFISGAIGKGAELLGRGVKSAGDAGQKALEVAGDAGNKVIDVAGDAASHLGDAAGTIADVAGNLGDVAGSAAEVAGDIASGAGEVLGDIIGGIADGL